MNLAIDIGSSLTKVASFDQSDLVELQTFKTLKGEDLATIFGRHKISNAIVSSVGNFRAESRDFLAANCNLMILTETLPIPIRNNYKSANTLGKDRLAGVIGASALYPSEDILVIDIGTCITYDFINSQNEFLGGAISPGLNIRFKSLHENTYNLPLVERHPIENFIGTDTKESILSGVIYGIIHEIHGAIENYKVNFKNLRVIATGGDLPFFESYFKSTIFAVPNLVLHGLNKILLHNAE